MGKLSVEEFILKAIESLRSGNFKGIHSVYSGFNDAFKDYFPGLNPIQETTRLANEGRIVIRPAKGGVMLYKPDEAPNSVNKGKSALQKMGLDE